ncbi:hypothetical protein G4Z16_05865 [Streptomyces bathyalis]|uniref:Uncharacterized protein n=1 Tax=Streptomyces bathyalis TaxID=2710756 RepID=A0A7T1T273_9ACTN|nr:hypothetical protein [Streptomyces bathyalis]QPP05014.1 hypothetical protein G4Z16_05865 [Streptomyces bathyalis]
MHIQVVLLDGSDRLDVTAPGEVPHAPRGGQRHRAGAPVGTVRPELEEVIPS